MPGFANDDARYLDAAADLDGVLAAVMELAQQVWVLTDRQAVIETLLARNGIVTSDDVDGFVPDSEQALNLARRREALLARVFAAFTHRNK